MFALFLVTLPAVNVRLYASDEVQYFAFSGRSGSIAIVSFDNEYRALYDRGVAVRAVPRDLSSGDGDRAAAQLRHARPGYPVAAVLRARRRRRLDARVYGATIERDGYSCPYIAAVCYGSAI